jgi:ribonuclease D
LILFQLIENEHQFSQGIKALGHQSRVSFDLEFDRDRHTYGFDLCLIQVGYENECLIIDPLAVESLRPLFDFFENPGIQKLVHCPGEDLRLLHHLGCYPKNIADTEVMAKLLNYEQTSLAKLLEVKCGIALNKKQQQSNWHLRPLHDDQLKYAADDVLYLPRLYDILYTEIEEMGLTAWVAAEQDWLQTVVYTLEKKTDFLKPGDKRNLSPWHAFVLNEMFVLRDRIGEKKNKPAYMVMPEDSVRALAEGSPEFHLQHLQGLHPSLRHGSAAAELKENILSIFSMANKKGLSRNAARQFFSEDEREQYQMQKNRQKWLKDHFWEPIRKKMADQYGAFAARYILSNGWITKWMNGEMFWKDLQPLYKQELVKSYAADLNLNYREIEAYEQEFTQIASE